MNAQQSGTRSVCSRLVGIRNPERKKTRVARGGGGEKGENKHSGQPQRIFLDRFFAFLALAAIAFGVLRFETRHSRCWEKKKAVWVAYFLILK